MHAFTTIRTRLARLRAEQDGQTLVEYALIAFLVALACVVFLSAVGLDLAETYDHIENALGIGGDNAVPIQPVGVSDTVPPAGAS